MFHINAKFCTCFTDVNNAPIINNLPETLLFDETIGKDTLLFTIDDYDADGDIVNVSYTVTPPQFSTKFTLTTNSKK